MVTRRFILSAHAAARHRVLALLSVLLLIAAMAGGGQASTNTVSLQVSMWINHAENVDKFRALLDQYEQEHPGVVLELIQQPWDGYHDKLITLAAAGLAPDVMLLSRAYLPAFAANGIVQPIDAWLAQETRFDVRRDVAELTSGMYEGEVYGIPIRGGPAIMAFNADMFAMAGAPLPSELAAAGDWSWERVIEIGKKLTADKSGDGTIDQYMLPGPSTWDVDWVTKIWGAGGRVLDEERTRARIAEPAAVQGLQLWVDLSRRHHIAPAAEEAWGSFPGGTQAISYVWISEAPNLFNEVKGSFRMDLVRMPAGTAGIFHVAGGCPVTISRTTQHPREAYDFAVWFAMDSGEWRLNGVPASLATIRRDYLPYLGQFFEHPGAVIEALQYPVHMEPGVGLRRTDLVGAWNPILERIGRGEISPQAGAAQIARLVDEILG